GARLETESGVTVDREVAERVRVRDRRAEGEAEGDRHAPHGPSHSATRAAPSSAASVVRATAAWRRSKYGLGGRGTARRSPRPGETRESVDARGVRRGDPFSL